MEPVIDFVEEPVREEQVRVERKPVIIYKPEYTPMPSSSPAPRRVKPGKRFILYAIILLLILLIGAAGFIIGKYF